MDDVLDALREVFLLEEDNEVCPIFGRPQVGKIRRFDANLRVIGQLRVKCLARELRG
ncbi:MAG: hypothetical protein WBE92_05515 [Steroidobacteraceae bacterium]